MIGNVSNGYQVDYNLEKKLNDNPSIQSFKGDCPPDSVEITSQEQPKKSNKLLYLLGIGVAAVALFGAHKASYLKKIPFVKSLYKDENAVKEVGKDAKNVVSDTVTSAVDAGKDAGKKIENVVSNEVEKVTVDAKQFKKYKEGYFKSRKWFKPQAEMVADENKIVENVSKQVKAEKEAAAAAEKAAKEKAESIGSRKWYKSQAEIAADENKIVENVSKQAKVEKEAAAKKGQVKPGKKWYKSQAEMVADENKIVENVSKQAKAEKEAAAAKQNEGIISKALNSIVTIRYNKK